MRVPFFRASVFLLVSTAVAATSIGPVYAQNYDEGVARTSSGYDAEGGQFEAPETVEAPEQTPRYERPGASNPATPSIWNPNASLQFAGAFCEDKIRGASMDTVAKLPGGGTVTFIDNFVMAPAQAAAQVQGSDGDEPLTGERVAAAVLALSQAGAQLVFPEIGLVVQGGQVLLGGTSYLIDSIASAARNQQTAAILGETDPGALGLIGNPGGYTPFIQFMQGTDWERYRGMTPDNLGEYFSNPDELTAAVGRWEARLRDVFFENNRRADNQRIVSELLVPRLYNIWLAQRVEHIIKLANVELTERARASLAQAQDSCKEPVQLSGDPWQGLHTGVVDTPVTFEWDTRIRIHGVVCFGGGETPLYFDHYHLNGQFVGADQREYYRVRNPAAAGGAFCGEWETRREVTGKGGGGPDPAAGDDYTIGNKL